MKDIHLKPEKHSKKVWIVSLGAIAITLGSISGCENLPQILSSSSPQPQVVDIDVNIPLTGPIASFSGQYANGLSMGIEDANKEYGLSQSEFNVNAADNAGKPAQAVSVLQKQLLTQTDVYATGTSDMAKAVEPTLQQQNIPYFLVAFDAYLAKDNKNSLRVLPHYKLEGPLYVKYAKLRNAKKVYILSLNISSIDEEFSKIVEPGLKKAGIEVQRDSFDFNTKDFKTLALKASQYKPDLIIISGFSFQLYPLLNSLRSLSMVKDGSVISTLDFVDLLHNNTPKDELTGVAFIAPEFEIPNAVPGAFQWRKKYKEQFGKDATYVEAYAYDTGRIIVAAKKKGGTVTEETIRSVLPFKGITGNIQLDQDGDLISTLTIAKISADGTIEEIK